MQQTDSRAAELQKILDNYKRINRIMGRGPVPNPVVLTRQVKAQLEPPPPPPKPERAKPGPKRRKLPPVPDLTPNELFEATRTGVGRFQPDIEKAIMARNKALRKGNDMAAPPLQDSEIMALFSPVPVEIHHHNSIAIRQLLAKVERLIFDRHGFTLRALFFSANQYKRWMSQARAEAYYIFMLVSGYGPTAAGDAFDMGHDSVIYGVERYKAMQKAGVWWTTGHFRGWRRPARNRDELGQAMPRNIKKIEGYSQSPGALKQAQLRARRREERLAAAAIRTNFIGDKT